MPDSNLYQTFTESFENDSHDAFSEGMVLKNEFELIQKLGHGGMGEVWKAKDITAGRNVVVKLIPPDIRNVELAMKQVREAFLKAHALQHQHICPILGLFDDSKYGLFVVMKFIDGKPLDVYRKDYFTANGCFPVSEAVQILWAVAKALDYAHERSVLHRDVKPRNIMISDDDGVQLIDFDLAAEIRSCINSISATPMDQVGTRPYMAPELWMGLVPDASTDQYALAVTAYELMAGQLPFHIPEISVLRECILNEEPVSIPGVADHVNNAIRKAMSKRREDRFESCKAFLKALATKPRDNSSPPAPPIQPIPPVFSPPTSPVPPDDKNVIAQDEAKQAALHETNATKQKDDAAINATHEKAKKNIGVKVIAAIAIVCLLPVIGLPMLATIRSSKQKVGVADNYEWLLLQDLMEDSLQEEKRQFAKDQQEAEEKRRAEEQRIAEEKQRAEEQRIAEEKQRAEEKRIAEEKQRAEEKRIAEEKQRAEEQRIAEEKQRAEEKRIAEKKRLADEKREESLKFDLARAIDLNTELKRNGFSNLRDARGRFERLSDFVGYGSAQLKTNMEKIRYSFLVSESVKDRAKTSIRTAQTKIAGKVFVAEYPYSISMSSYSKDAEMTIVTGFESSEVELILFPMPNVTGKMERSFSDNVELALSGSEDSIKELNRNKNEYRAKVWFKNLRPDDDYAIRIAADILKIEIVDKDNQAVQTRPPLRQ